MVTPNRPLIYYGTAFNGDPFDGAVTPTWSDLTARLTKVDTASRGRQYELDQNQAGTMSAEFMNIDEALNPVNAGSPYSPNVLPYRQTVFMAQWPQAPAGGAVNLLNLANPDYRVDPSFESYATGSVPAWILQAGAITSPVVTATTPFQGTRAFSYGVTAGGGTMGVGVNIPTIPGKQYTSTWYIRQTAANTTQIFINGGAGGTSTATTGAYVRLSLTWTATQPTHQLYVASFATASSGTVIVDAVQHEPGAVANTFTTSGPILRNLWTRGYTERYPTSWGGNGYEGQSATPVIGPFAILQNADLHTEIRNAIMAKAPSYYWPLQEPNNSTIFAESSGNNGPPLQLTVSPVGAGSSVFTPGTTTNVAGDNGGAGVRTAPVGGTEGTLNAAFQCLQLGYTSTSQRLVGPSAAAGSSTTWSCSSAFILTRPAANLNGGVAYVRFVSPTNSVATALIGSTGGNLLIPNTSADLWGDGKPHIFINVQSLAATNLTRTWYVDGVLAGTDVLGGFGSGFDLPSLVVNIGGAVTYTFNQAWQDQTAAHVAYWNRALTAFEIADLSNAFKGYNGENSGARISRYLSVAGWVGPTFIQTGSSQLGPATVKEGDSALASCQDVANSEFGNFYEGAAGISFASRFSRYLTTASAFTLGESVSAGEYPYEGDINFDTDPTLVLNIADITQSLGIKAHAEDGPSQLRYGKKNFTRTVALLSANETQDAATWVIYNRKAPTNRVASVTLNPGSTNNLPTGDGTMWAMIIALEVGTRVTLKRRPKAANAGAGITQSGDYFVESITHHDINFEEGTWQTTLLLSPVPLAQPWILQDSTYGQLGITTVLGF